MDSFLRGHVEAFAAFGGLARVLLYDNLKSAVLERVGDAIRFNPTLLAFAGHYRYEPRPVAVARGNEKGRVERAIRYVRDSFFARASLHRPGRPERAGRVRGAQGQAADRRWPEDARIERARGLRRRAAPACWRCPRTALPWASAWPSRSARRRTCAST